MKWVHIPRITNVKNHILRIVLILTLELMQLLPIIRPLKYFHDRLHFQDLISRVMFKFQNASRFLQQASARVTVISRVTREMRMFSFRWRRIGGAALRDLAGLSGGQGVRCGTPPRRLRLRIGLRSSYTYSSTKLTWAFAWNVVS